MLVLCLVELPCERARRVDDAEPVDMPGGEHDLPGRIHIDAVDVGPLPTPDRREDRILDRIEQLPDVDAAHLVAGRVDFD